MGNEEHPPVIVVAPLVTAIVEFRDAFAHGDEWEPAARNFTCGEAEALHALLTEIGCGDIADQMLDAHALADEPSDDHYIPYEEDT